MSGRTWSHISRSRVRFFSPFFFITTTTLSSSPYGCCSSPPPLPQLSRLLGKIYVAIGTDDVDTLKWLLVHHLTHEAKVMIQKHLITSGSSTRCLAYLLKTKIFSFQSLLDSRNHPRARAQDILLFISRILRLFLAHSEGTYIIPRYGLVPDAVHCICTLGYPDNCEPTSCQTWLFGLNLRLLSPLLMQHSITNLENIVELVMAKTKARKLPLPPSYVDMLMTTFNLVRK